MMSSLYIAASGMRSYNAGMQSISNNLANTNTIGFKQSMMLYMDMPSNTANTPSTNVTNFSQPGAGVSIGTNRTLFTQGGYESSNTVTDMAVNGIGYFGVMKDGVMHYTRAGNFRFDADGNLLDPNGYALIGRSLATGAVGPVQVDATNTDSTSAAKATNNVQLLSNLGSTTDKSVNETNPLFSLASKWDGTAKSPVGNGEYSHTESVPLYDATGKAHQATVYYDYAGTQSGKKIYEYVVGIDPKEDGSALAGTKSAGLLMAGTMTFSSEGDMVGMTGFTPTGVDPSSLTDWKQAGLQNGVPTFQAIFAGQGAQNVSLDMGLKLAGGWDPSITSPADGTSNPTAFYNNTPGATLNPQSSTSYGTNNYSKQRNQDGYPVGNIKDMVVGQDGTVSARYSNGTTKDLYQVNLYHFQSYDGLKREGMNHFSATPESGPAIEGTPGTVNFGTISSNKLEQSNVDMSREFTQMIITQRAFQMNSKAVTTSDSMLQRALELKR